MSTTFSNPTKEEKAAKSSEIQQYWKNLLGVNHKNSYIIPKFVYTPQGNVEKAIRCFASEMNKGDILVELVDSNYDPINKERCLYILHQRKDFAEHYEATTYDSFIVPVSEMFVFVTEKHIQPLQTVAPAIERIDLDSPKPKLGEMVFISEKVKSDEPFSALTIRDLYSVLHNKPVSNKRWLNELIQTNL